MEKSGETYNNNLRRVFHFTAISILALVYGLGPWSPQDLASTVSIFTLTVILIDLLRLHIESLNEFVQKHFRFILRKHEFYTISGSSWFLLGAIISLMLYSKILSVFGFLCLAAGDPIASYVGISATQGQKIGQKTWHGTGAFFLATWLVGGLWFLRQYSPALAFGSACCGSLGAAITERVLIEFDDNFMVPLVASGLAMGFLAYFQ